MPKAALITNLCLERLLRFTVKRLGDDIQIGIFLNTRKEKLNTPR